MEEFETYADVIDSWNISSEKAGGKSLTDYIKDNNKYLNYATIHNLDCGVFLCAQEIEFCCSDCAQYKTF